MGKVKDYLIGKKVDRRIDTKCTIPLNFSSLMNFVNVLRRKDGKFKLNCKFEKGDKFLGNMDISTIINKKGLQIHTSSTSGLIGTLARESDVLEEFLGI